MLYTQSSDRYMYVFVCVSNYVAWRSYQLNFYLKISILCSICKINGELLGQFVNKEKSLRWNKKQIFSSFRHFIYGTIIVSTYFEASQPVVRVYDLVELTIITVNSDRLSMYTSVFCLSEFLNQSVLYIDSWRHSSRDGNRRRK